jgi:hypothetical protein
MAFIKQIENKSAVRMWANWNPCALLTRMGNNTAAMQNSDEVLQKITHNYHVTQ